MVKRILVIGELNVDMIVSGLDGFPTLGREILADALRLVMGSSSAICAAGLARLGVRVDFLGKVGVDSYGDFIVDELQRLGVGTRHLIRDDVVRTGMTIALAYPQDRALITYLGCISHFQAADISPSAFQGYDHLHVGSYFLQKGLQPGLPALFDQARHAGLTVSLDTGWDPEERWGDGELLNLLGQVDVFLPNADEACVIARADNVEAALHELGRRAGLVVVKRGAMGAMALEGGQILYSPGFQVTAVDTTGAGDSFNAGFLFAHVVQHDPLEEALRFANACGALSTTGYGGTAAQPTVRQALDLLTK